MNEQLLQYIWQYRLYQSKNLRTLCGKDIIIEKTGILNYDQGPDFLHARIQINGTKWAGHVELHVSSSDWHLHGHWDDPHYSNVILHVVWQHDRKLDLPFPTLVLQEYVTLSMLQRYVTMQKNKGELPCASHQKHIPDIVIQSTMQRALIERLENRAEEILKSVKQYHGNWELVFKQLLAKSLGGRINGFAFSQSLQALPVSIWKRNVDEEEQLEACLFGISNMLSGDFIDVYPNKLQQIYFYEKQKHQFPKLSLAMSYFRMRPSSFPTIRMSILARLLKRSISWADLLAEISNVSQFRSFFLLKPSPYWQTHYRFDQPAKKSVNYSVNTLQDQLIVNAYVPMLYTFGRYYHEADKQEIALAMLEELQKEENRVVRHFLLAGMRGHTAADTQGMLHLYQCYCLQKRCLQCGIGLAILKREKS